MSLLGLFSFVMVHPKEKMVAAIAKGKKTDRFCIYQNCLRKVT